MVNMKLKPRPNDKIVLALLPEQPNETIGTFKVKARRDDGGSNFAVAIYSNGREMVITMPLRLSPTTTVAGS